MYISALSFRYIWYKKYVHCTRTICCSMVPIYETSTLHFQDIQPKMKNASAFQPTFYFLQRQTVLRILLLLPGFSCIPLRSSKCLFPCGLLCNAMRYKYAMSVPDNSYVTCPISLHVFHMSGIMDMSGLGITMQACISLKYHICNLGIVLQCV